MNLGIIMSLYNNIYFGDTLSTICEFVPQVGVRERGLGQRPHATWFDRCACITHHIAPLS